LGSKTRFTHKKLIEKSKLGNRKAQYRLYKLYIVAMYNTSSRILKNKEDAEDIIQESFIEAFKNLKKFKYESSFGFWLKRIVINKSINHIKQKRIPIQPHIDEANIPIIEEVTYDQTVSIEKVKMGIDRLAEGYKQIINLYLIEGYDHNEIGEILGIKTTTSKSQYHRAKKRLIEIIKTL